MDQAEKDQKIAEYRAKLDKLEAQAEAGEESAKAEIEELKSKLSSVLSSWADAAEDAWAGLEEEANAAWTALQQKMSEGKDDQ